MISRDDVNDAIAATARVRDAMASLAAGRMIVVADDQDRENEGDLILAAEFATESQLAFMVRYTTGIVCAPMPPDRCDELRLPQMVAENFDAHGTAFTVSVDSVGTGTGVAAADRAKTLRALADAECTAVDFRRPGHIFPLRSRAGGVLIRAGHTEAAVDLLTAAGLSGVGVISELTDDDGTMLRGASLVEFARDMELPFLTVADVVRYRGATERLVEAVGTASMPTSFGDFHGVAYRNILDGTEHLALVMGDVVAASQSSQGALVRVHSECLTGDALGSLRCDCGAQLEAALAAIAAEGAGALIYLRGHEGRGIGLAHKIRAYALQEQGMDTMDANIALGLPVDSRTYGVGAQMLSDLGIARIRLITNNPAKYGGLEGYGIEIVSRIASAPNETSHNVHYLRTKRDRMGHDFLISGSL